MNNPEGKWSYNRSNDEFWNKDLFDTREEAIKAAIAYGKENKYSAVEIGQCTSIPLPCYVDVDNIIENLEESYSEEAGGEYDDSLYSDVKQEDLNWLEEELSKVIFAFNERAGIESIWYTVSNISSITIKHEGEVDEE